MDDIKQLAVELKTAADEVKRVAETTNTEVKNLGKVTAETKQKADEAMVKHNEIAARTTEIEQKMARGPQEPEQRKSFGARVVETDDVKNFMASSRRGSVSIDVKAIISSLTTDANGSAGDLIVPDRRGLIDPVQRRMTIRDLLTPGNTSSNAIQYVKETGFTIAAATHTETAGTRKPQSDIKFDLMTTGVTTIAHWVQATKQILDDVPMLQSYLDGRLRYGLMYKEEDQLLNGDGSGTELNGIFTQATTFSSPITGLAGATKVDVIRLAMLQAFLAEYPANGIVLHPTDWAGIELTKDMGGNYLMSDPSGSIAKRLWGLPVIDTQAMVADDFLVGAFQLGAQVFDREEATVTISTEDDQNFTKNLVTILAEERLALAVYRPEAFIKGSFEDALDDVTA
ncbi:phage major capsid protein [Falsigemmobacter faecalis]|uniref:Phage major capsid protein n=1 Tax=Falsigemmobacter faecalis TaxID=2488730 RepID=A0A3P3DCN0_9RHOB|nr:phage major capsid protein [Falsigemmobacter faecalis]RRH72001.1 phage major capsid protein [Falsigemmobacter faecalis]